MGGLDWIGRHSLSLWLVHQPLVRAMVHPADTPHGLVREWIGCAVALLLTPVAAMGLEYLSNLATAVVPTFKRASGTGPLPAGWRSSS
jgi:peptidoglycan/LPS O-acetylase OafA/YrhL